MTKTREFLKKLRPSPLTLALPGLIAYLWFRPPAWVVDMHLPAPDMTVNGVAGVRSLDEDAAVVLRYLAEAGYTFPAGLAGEGVTAACGGVSRLPMSFIIDRQGAIRHRISGQVHDARLKGLVLPLLRQGGRS